MRTAGIEQSIRVAGEADVAAVAATLDAAFAADPVLAWCFPDPVRRPVLSPAFFRIAVEDALPGGEVFALGAGPAAGAVWLPPAEAPDEAAEAALLARFAEAAQEYGERMGVIFELMADVHPHDPHAYLFLLGARPEHQGRGCGSALLRHVTARLDRDGVPAYLEATTEGNRRLYLRHGFRDRGAPIQLPEGPAMYPMWRAPQPT